MALGRPRDLTLSALYFVIILFIALYFGVNTYWNLRGGPRLSARSGPRRTRLDVEHEAPASFDLESVRHCPLAPGRFRQRDVRSGLGAGISGLAGFGAWPRLLAESLAGAIVYAACVVALWLATGRPPGAEAYSLARLKSFACRNRAPRDSRIDTPMSKEDQVWYRAYW